METLSHWFGPLHPPFTHFPIACSFLALVAFGWGLWRSLDWALKASGALWLFALAGALAAFVTGHLFAHHLAMLTDWSLFPPETVMKGKLKDHVGFAFLGILFLVAGTGPAWSLMMGRKVNAWVAGLLLLGASASMAVTGHEGGEMVYEDTEPVGATQEAPATGAVVAPDEVWGRVQDYRKKLVLMDSSSWNSRTHGHRWVNTYVSPEAAKAYQDSDVLPEGALVVKESFEDEGGKASQVPGPLYVMEKGKKSDSPRTGGWRYAFRWDNPVAGNPENIKMPVTWISGDSHLGSCIKCHSRFKDTDYLAGIPEGHEKP